ncbi:MAG: Stp1/IreP family PP2C-type Ser/Thr phosphatase [Anaerolineae bacterium]|nr:Stp1/IreP family PP2C-type Ser/Thr phosphatase [Anaerolineae bacterium]
MGNDWHTRTALACDIGRKRRNNEDYALACEPEASSLQQSKGHLYIVADGIGGGAGGEIASRFAALAVAFHYYDSPASPSRSLHSAIARANDSLYRYAHTHARLATMGTTIVCAAVQDDHLYVAHAGDSRAYLLRNGNVRLLTEDHNLAAQLAREGLISREQASHHPQRHLLLRSLGGESTVSPDFAEARLQPQDAVILCSDGLTRHVDEAELAAICAQSPEPQEAVRTLVELANSRGGEDNIAVILARWDRGPLATPRAHGVLAAPPEQEPTVEAVIAALAEPSPYRTSHSS